MVSLGKSIEADLVSSVVVFDEIPRCFGKSTSLFKTGALAFMISRDIVKLSYSGYSRQVLG